MKKSKDVQKPQHHANDHDRIQNRLNGSLHWYIAVDQPEQDTYDNQHYYYLK